MFYQKRSQELEEYTERRSSYCREIFSNLKEIKKDIYILIVIMTTDFAEIRIILAAQVTVEKYSVI